MVSQPKQVQKKFLRDKSERNVCPVSISGHLAVLTWPKGVKLVSHRQTKYFQNVDDSPSTSIVQELTNWLMGVRPRHCLKILSMCQGCDWLANWSATRYTVSRSWACVRDVTEWPTRVEPGTLSQDPEYVPGMWLTGQLQCNHVHCLKILSMCQECDWLANWSATRYTVSRSWACVRDVTDWPTPSDNIFIGQ